MEATGLVLEGGGMRGLYTAGVLEYFLEQNLYFPYVIGVSAGACMAASYLSRQEGRNKKVNIELVSDPRYLSFRNFIRKRELFGMDFLFDEIPTKIVPFDFETFLSEKQQFVVVTTDCETGEAIYFNKHEHGNDILKILRASSSIPFIAPAVEYNKKYLLDGGIIDPIPVKKSQQDGYIKNVVIMTKPKHFKRRPSKAASVVKYLYKRHPMIASLLQERYKIYNDTLSFIEEEKTKGNVFVLQPSVGIPVGRIERNQKKLTELYELGYNDAKSQFNQLKQFLIRQNQMIKSKEG
ncbi:patatin-like phospholipase family protein [Halalkalibacterium ligniniphilum]|uniref:patatin-like phospholipase family protein n=1 Tax=Halalkalibacterium ligniniphilum TaxID=1134413 RepID=UPI000349710E|nr:patatin family protein [Halalkalibacterium ligniniphilum]